MRRRISFMRSRAEGRAPGFALPAFRLSATITSLRSATSTCAPFASTTPLSPEALGNNPEGLSIDQIDRELGSPGYLIFAQICAVYLGVEQLHDPGRPQD